jgi:hypothetical protein
MRAGPDHGLAHQIAMHADVIETAQTQSQNKGHDIKENRGKKWLDHAPILIIIF